MKELAVSKWNECLALIRKKLNNDTAYASWFEPTEATGLNGNTLTLQLPSMFVKELYEGQYFPLLKEACVEVFGPNVKIIYRVLVVSNTKGGSVKMAAVGPTPKPETEKKPASAPTTPKAIPAAKKGRQKSEANPETANFLPELNQALSFENYCVGSCNKLPWSIAESIARNPFNSNFNPFFLYGDVGVGKTHLMQAIGLQVKALFPEKMVVFLPMKEFQRLYQHAYLNDQIPAFLNWFMKCDVLLFDDLQEIAGSTGTLNNALFPIFNHLHQHGRQLVFTCDRPPHELKELEDRLIDRFKWGVIEKLERPDASLRKKILTFKAKKNGLNLPGDVIEYIANTPLNSVREIEGIVLGMWTRSINLGLEIDVPLAREVISRAVKPVKRKAIHFDMIVEAVAEAYRLNSDVIFSKSRVKDVADARMVIMYLAQKMLGLSMGSIGLKLGRKHSTVIHGIRTITGRMDAEPDLRDKVAEVEAAIG